MSVGRGLSWYDVKESSLIVCSVVIYPILSHTGVDYKGGGLILLGQSLKLQTSNARSPDGGGGCLGEKV